MTDHVQRGSRRIWEHVRKALNPKIPTQLSLASILFALGNSRYAAIGNMAKLAFLAVELTVAFSRFGFHEALWVLALAPLASYVAILFGLRRHCAPVMRTSFAGFAAITALATLFAR